MKNPAPPTLAPRKPRPKTPWKTPVSVTLPPELLREIDARGENRSEIVRADLGRYYRLLAEARGRLRGILTPDELCAIIDEMNGHWYAEAIDHGEITANVEDGCRLEGFDKKWGIDGAALVRKLRDLDLLAVHALADATQRFWQADGGGDERRDPRRTLE